MSSFRGGSHGIIASRLFLPRVAVLSIVLAIVAACASPAVPQPSSTLARLDALVSNQGYGEALRALERDPSSAEEKLQWLRVQAERGHVPMIYELSARLFPTDVSQSLKWYARGRLARTLDAAECAQGSASWGWRVNLDRQVETVRDAGVARPREFSAAIDEALAWDAKRRDRPSAAWICGPVDDEKDHNLLPQPKRDAERADTRETMVINAKAIADFYKAVDAGAAAKFRTLESNIDVPEGLIRRSAGWLDDHRLLFVGRQPDENARRRGSSPFTDLYLWDTEADRITLVRTEAAMWDLCVDGLSVVLAYTNARDADRVWLATGTFPQLTEERVDLETRNRLFRRSDCKPIEQDPRIRRGSDVSWLRSEDGFVLHEGGGLTLYRPNGTVIALNAGNESFPLRGYAPFTRSYLFLGGSRDRKTGALKWSSGAKPGESIVLFSMQSDGRTQSFDVPYGLWHRASGEDYQVSRRGVLLAGGWSDNENTPGFAGVYLFETSGITLQLVRGPSAVMGVSRNGCRIAIANAATRSAALMMKVVDICIHE